MTQRVTVRLVGTAVLAGLLGVAVPARAQKGEIPIWPGAAPGSEKWTQNEVTFTGFGNQQIVRNVVRPTLTRSCRRQARRTARR